MLKNKQLQEKRANDGVNILGSKRRNRERKFTFRVCIVEVIVVGKNIFTTLISTT